MSRPHRACSMAQRAHPNTFVFGPDKFWIGTIFICLNTIVLIRYASQFSSEYFPFTVIELLQLTKGV
jgi:hypothetical protein